MPGQVLALAPCGFGLVQDLVLILTPPPHSTWESMISPLVSLILTQSVCNLVQGDQFPSIFRLWAIPTRKIKPSFIIIWPRLSVFCMYFLYPRWFDVTLVTESMHIYLLDNFDNRTVYFQDISQMSILNSVLSCAKTLEIVKQLSFSIISGEFWKLF